MCKLVPVYKYYTCQKSCHGCGLSEFVYDSGDQFSIDEPIQKINGGVNLNLNNLQKNSGCVDENPLCPLWARSGECENNPGFITICRSSCNGCFQTNLASGSKSFFSYHQLFFNNIFLDPNCGDSDPQCNQWAEVGECETNPNFMRSQCKFSCGFC